MTNPKFSEYVCESCWKTHRTKFGDPIPKCNCLEMGGIYLGDPAPDHAEESPMPAHMRSDPETLNAAEAALHQAIITMRAAGVHPIDANAILLNWTMLILTGFDAEAGLQVIADATECATQDPTKPVMTSARYTKNKAAILTLRRAYDARQTIETAKPNGPMH